MHGCLQSITQFYGSLEKLKLIIAVRGELHNKKIIGYTWDTTSSMRNLKYFLADYYKNKPRLQKLYSIGENIQANVKHRFLVNLDSIYREYFPEYCNYFGRPLSLKKSMFGVDNSGNIFADELTNWMIDEAGFK